MSILTPSVCLASGLVLLLRWLFTPQYITLKNKHVCITGGSQGASSVFGATVVDVTFVSVAVPGIGLSVAQECIKRGATAITLIARSRVKILAALDLLSQINPSCKLEAFLCDVTNSESVAYVFETLNGSSSCQTLQGSTVDRITSASGDKLTASGPVDVLVNCAGICICDEFDALMPEEIEYQIKLNICGTLYPCREVGSLSRENYRLTY